LRSEEDIVKPEIWIFFFFFFLTCPVLVRHGNNLRSEEDIVKPVIWNFFYFLFLTCPLRGGGEIRTSRGHQQTELPLRT
jgi:hypothetical protein